MELWIRSQDKERITKIDEVYYSSDDYGHYVMCYKDQFTGYKLGKYKSKERALEVLDEIQSFIENNYEADIPSCSGNLIANGRIVFKTRRIVYEIPKEQEEIWN